MHAGYENAPAITTPSLTSMEYSLGFRLMSDGRDFLGLFAAAHLAAFFRGCLAINTVGGTTLLPKQSSVLLVTGSRN